MHELRTLLREELEPVKAALQRGVSPVAPERPSGEFMTNAEAMAYLGLSRATLARYRADGTLPYSKLGQSVYYPIAEVEALLAARMVNRADAGASAGGDTT